MWGDMTKPYPCSRGGAHENNWLKWRAIVACIVFLALLSPSLLVAQQSNSAAAQTPPAAVSGPATNAAPAPVTPAVDKLPWLEIIIVALVLGAVAFVILRLTGGEGKQRSSGRSRGGWVLSSEGMGESNGSPASDDDSKSNSSSNFTGGGAGSTW